MLSSIVEACKAIMSKRSGAPISDPTSRHPHSKSDWVKQLEEAFEARQLQKCVEEHPYDVRFAQTYLSAQFERLADLTRSCFHQPHLLTRRKNLINLYKSHITTYVREHPTFKATNPPFYQNLKASQLALWEEMKTSWSSV